MKTRHRRAGSAAAVALFLLGAAALVGPARAAEPAPTDGFTCRASAVRTAGSSISGLNIEPFTANEEGGACADDGAGLLGPTAVTLPGSLGSLEVLTARTDGDAHTAEASVAQVVLTPLAGTTITATALSSRAGTGACPSPSLSGSSEIVEVRVNGLEVAAPTMADDTPELTIPGVGALHLDYQTNSGGVLTQRALFLDVDQDGLLTGAVPDIVVAEAVADIHGEPCAQPPGTEGPPGDETCSDGLDNDGDGAVDLNDPDCQPPVVDEGRCPAPSPEGEDSTPDKDCGFGKPSDVNEPPKGGRGK
ncbi:MAG: choice-of-anchor P family protein [Actinomycetota bacterium]